MLLLIVGNYSKLWFACKIDLRQLAQLSVRVEEGRSLTKNYEKRLKGKAQLKTKRLRKALDCSNLTSPCYATSFDIVLKTGENILSSPPWVYNMFNEVSKYHMWASKLFFVQSANRKSANSWVHSAITNPQISKVCQSANHKSACFVINPSIANQQIYKKHYSTMSQNSPKRSLRLTLL